MRTIALAALLAVTLGAGRAQAQVAAAPAAAPKVKITAPAPNAVVTGTSVHVTLAATGIEIAPAAEHKPGTRRARRGSGISARAKRSSRWTA